MTIENALKIVFKFLPVILKKRMAKTFTVTEVNSALRKSGQ